MYKHDLTKSLMAANYINDVILIHTYKLSSCQGYYKYHIEVLKYAIKFSISIIASQNLKNCL